MLYGAHFEPNTGTENKDPITAIATKPAVTVNFFMFVFFISNFAFLTMILHFKFFVECQVQKKS